MLAVHQVGLDNSASKFSSRVPIFLFKVLQTDAQQMHGGNKQEVSPAVVCVPIGV